ncbi:MAG: hypothetical protein CL607_16925 [Anaerolineaceae bacterium]|nr:hypothetical protein [Anaerolineaceae bacterium]
MQAADYQAFTNQLTQNLQADPRVVGLVLVGSTANQSHAPDAWSDHDFFAVTESGVQEQFRTQFDWLPDHENIVLTVRETEHGLKILYQSGHLLECAIFDLDEIGLAKVNDYKVAFDRGDVTERVERIAVPNAILAPSPASIQRDLGMVPCLLLVGAGRVKRGEAISGQVFIRSHAVSHLLTLLAHHLPSDNKATLDNLDPFRRFEQVFPEVGQQINAALSREPIAAALGLLAVYEAYLSDSDGYPAQAVEAVRDVLKNMLSD